jgi:hypothetical protein
MRPRGAAAAAPLQRAYFPFGLILTFAGFQLLLLTSSHGPGPL